jgi:ABC-type amino acid transport substrate-binding protein
MAAHADTIDRIRESGTIRLAHRTDAAPFASLDAAGQAVGYSVELCRRVADAIKASMPERTLTMQFVPVTALDRFEAIAQERADLLCEATTVSLGRREQLDFSLLSYVTGGESSFAAAPRRQQPAGRSHRRRAQGNDHGDRDAPSRRQSWERG